MERYFSETQTKQLVAEMITPFLRRINEVEKRVVELEGQNAQLKKRVVELENENATLKKDSSNSSKPPSSDIVKPPSSSPSKAKGKALGKIGGQVGHVRHERCELPPEQVDRFQTHVLERCPDCGGTVQATGEVVASLQQMELVPKPVEVIEHHAARVRCTCCLRYHDTPLPAGIRKAGLLGPRLTALLGWFKSQGHDSYSIMAEFLRDVAGCKVSRGLLAKAIQKVSHALAEPYALLSEALVHEPVLNVDETGHPENKKRMWTWVFRADKFTVFHIDPSRGSQVLDKVLSKEFKGVLGCDYFSAYRKYMNRCDEDGNKSQVLTQFCLAHLIRDLKFIAGLKDAQATRWANQMLAGMRRLFGVIHRREKMSPAGFQRSLEKARDVVLLRGKRGPPRNDVQNLVERFRKHGDAYFRFVTEPGISPTNNLAEQALRCVVIDRRLTQGTRSFRGREWCARIWTIAATCRQQARSFFDYLSDAHHASFEKQPIPSPLLTKL